MALSKKQQKLVDTIAHRVEMTREFMNDWLLFNQILSAYPSPGVNKAQLENQFLKIKSKLARSHKVLKDTIGSDYALDGATMNIVSNATNLESIYSQSEVAVKKLQTEWHRAFIAINETLGTLDDKRVRAGSGVKVFIPPAFGSEGAATGGGGGGTEMSKNTRTLLIIAGIIVAIALFFVVNPGGFANTWLNSMDVIFGTKFGPEPNL